MPNFENITPPTSAFIDENNDIQDIQSVLESGAVVVTSVAAGPVIPIGVATTPKFENIAPWAGKFVNSSNEIIELIEFLTSGAISVQITGTHGDAPVTGSYITKIDETAVLTNSIPLSGLPTGFLASTTISGDLITRIFSGTANQVTVLNGDGVSGNPAFSLSASLIFPGTATLGGTLDVKSHAILSTTSELTLNSPVGVKVLATLFSASNIASNSDSTNRINLTAIGQDFLVGGLRQIDTSFSGVRFGGANSRVTTILDEDDMSSNSDTALSTQQSIKAYVDSSSVFSEEIRGYFDGLFVETPDISFSSDGATITLSLQKLGGGDLTILYSTGEFTLDSTPPVTISLIAGTDDSPIENYIYIPIGTKVLTVSTSGFPSAEEYCAVAEALCQAAASVQVDGLYKTHEWTSHMSDEVGNGHSSHLDFWIRRQNATWLAGVSLTPTLGALQFSIATSVGEVLQLHKHEFSAFDTSSGSHVYVQNSFSVPYQRVTDLTSILTDANGASMAGKNFNLVVWGSVNSNNIDQLYINVPSATYNNDSSAINDISGTSIYAIGDDFKGNGFLISRLTIKHQTTGGGVWSLLNNEDLRGKIPSNAAGGGTGGIDAVVEDTTPQLGGDLDVNGFIIKGVSATVDFLSPIGVNIDAPQTRVVSLAYIDLITNRIDFSPAAQTFLIESIQRMRITSAGLQLATGATVNNIDNTGASILSTDLMTAFGMQSAIATALVSGNSFRGAWDASVNLYPATGGSGVSGAILMGDWWYISVSGTLGANPVEPGDQIFAIADTPGQSDANWLVVIQKVDSVFGRVGNVVSANNDYAFPQISGTASETQGGTNQTTYVTGDLIHASGADTLSKLPIGSPGQVLTVVAGDTSWEATPTQSYGNITFSAMNISGVPFPLVALFTEITDPSIPFLDLGSSADMSEVSNGRLQYTGVDDKKFMVSASAALTITNAQIVTITIYLNGVLHGGSIYTNKIPYPIINYPITMSSGDYVSVALAAVPDANYPITMASISAFSVD